MTRKNEREIFAADKAAGRAWVRGGPMPPRATHDFLLLRSWLPTSLTWLKLMTFAPSQQDEALAAARKLAANINTTHGSRSATVRVQLLRLTGPSAEKMNEQVLFDSDG